MFHGKGGYDWETVYNMPIWLRRFTWNSVNEWYEKQNEEQQQATPKENIPKGPNIAPTYSTKASK